MIIKDRRIKFGIIGCGNMGYHYVRILNDLKGAEVTAICDTNQDLLNKIKDQYNCDTYTDYKDIIDKVDAVCISTPTTIHAKVVKFFIDNNIPLIVEKPLASTVAECYDIYNLSKTKDFPMLVGHIERFNPAFVQLARILNTTETLVALDIKRLSHSSQRINDVDVIMDLMIHDIDIVLSLLGNDELMDIKASGYGNSKNNLDYVVALLTSKKGKVISLTSSRITSQKLRELQATTVGGHMVLNFIEQNLSIYRKGNILVSEKDPEPHYSIDLGMEKVIVKHEEPLSKELRHFISCLQGKEKPEVSIHDGLVAVETAYKIKEAVKVTISKESEEKLSKVTNIKEYVNR